MATPSGKNNNMGATPTPFASSPFPSATPMGRPLSHKSPSIRTPSASGYHHQNHPSLSSFQYPTPLAANTSLEEAATFSSPSALLALGLGGITPSLSANGGLGVQGVGDSGIQGIGIPTLSMSGPRDTEEEKRRNLERCVELLRERIAGRGVCREGLFRLGAAEGLECLWQEDVLTIAGKYLDLEIEFWTGRDYVKDVSLKYATPDAGGGEKRVKATEVLQRNLLQSPEDQEQGLWKDPEQFHKNLCFLANLDHLSDGINCFYAIEGIIESLSRIWAEERQPSSSTAWQDACRSTVGRPCMHVGEKLGFRLQYWADQPRVLDNKPKPKPKPDDQMDVDDSPPSSDEEQEEKGKVWALMIDCEPGYPPLRISKDWVGSPVFTATHGGEESTHTGGDQIRLVNWTEPPETLVDMSNTGAMDIDSSLLRHGPPDRRFVARLDPPIDMPVTAAAEIHRLMELPMPDDYKASTYDGLLFRSPGTVSQHAVGQLADQPSSTSDRRVTQEVYGFPRQNENEPAMRRHEFAFHAFDQVTGRTIKDLPFSHPRQLADVIPILRQYALLLNILGRSFEQPAKTPTKKQKETSGEPWESASMPAFLSNEDPTAAKLDAILSDVSNLQLGQQLASGTTAEPSGVAPQESSTPQPDVKIDVSLRSPMLPYGPSIMLILNAAQEISRPITMRIDVNRNGRLNVSELAGISFNEEGPADLEAKQKELSKKLARTLESSQDLSLLAEWTLRWVRRQRQAAV